MLICYALVVLFTTKRTHFVSQAPLITKNKSKLTGIDKLLMCTEMSTERFDRYLKPNPENK